MQKSNTFESDITWSLTCYIVSVRDCATVHPCGLCGRAGTVPFRRLLVLCTGKKWMCHSVNKVCFECSLIVEKRYSSTTSRLCVLPTVCSLQADTQETKPTWKCSSSNGSQKWVNLEPYKRNKHAHSLVIKTIFGFFKPFHHSHLYSVWDIFSPPWEK